MKDKRIECGCHRECTMLPHECAVPCRWPDCLSMEEMRQLVAEIENDELGECEKEHRLPAGPNEDTGRCSCGRMSFEMRPEGETYGWHLDDCSLPIRHQGRCEPGGAGHPPAPVIRGYWR